MNISPKYKNMIITLLVHIVQIISFCRYSTKYFIFQIMWMMILTQSYLMISENIEVMMKGKLLQICV